MDLLLHSNCNKWAQSCAQFVHRLYKKRSQHHPSVSRMHLEASVLTINFRSQSGSLCDVCAVGAFFQHFKLHFIRLLLCTSFTCRLQLLALWWVNFSAHGPDAGTYCTWLKERKKERTVENCHSNLCVLQSDEKWDWVTTYQIQRLMRCKWKMSLNYFQIILKRFSVFTLFKLQSANNRKPQLNVRTCSLRCCPGGLLNGRHSQAHRRHADAWWRSCAEAWHRAQLLNGSSECHTLK